MNAVARSALGVAVVAGALALLAGASRWSWTATPGNLALIRLDWRARGERVEECRPLTPEEAAELPPHMRRPEVCEGKFTPYALRVAVDGRPVVEDTVRGAGARQDRPVYVSREIAVRPGHHRLEIRFEKLDGATRARREPAHEEGEGVHDEAEEDHDRPEVHAAEVTPSLRLEGAFALAPRQVLVVTYDPDQRRLVASRPAAP